MKPVLVIQLFFAVVSTMAAQQFSNADAARNEILSTIGQQVKGWNSGNIEAFMQGYSRTDTLRFASGGSVTYGWQPMLDRYRKSYPNRATMGMLTFTDISVELISRDAAMVFGTWRLKREKDEPWGLFTLLFKKMNGEWRIVHDHASSGN
jgi:ketosteroid isomerase-like protein